MAAAASTSSAPPASPGTSSASARPSITGLEDIPVGVITGDNLLKLFRLCSAQGRALSAFNCASTLIINRVLQSAKNIKSPVVVQISNEDAAYVAGRGISVSDQQAAVVGSITLAHHVKEVAKRFGVRVVLQTGTCDRNLLPWLDGVLEADEEYFKAHGEPLFSSHMLDLSEEKDDENIATCIKYFTRMTKMKMWLETKFGVKGDEEADADNMAELYTTSARVVNIYEALRPIGPMFCIAPAFGNTHDVNKPDSVKLEPRLLDDHQKFIKERSIENPPVTSIEDKPAFFAMHGGSGYNNEEISEAVRNGVVKMNIDTDTHWAYWNEVYGDNTGYLKRKMEDPAVDDQWNIKRQMQIILNLQKEIDILNGTSTREPRWPARRTESRLSCPVPLCGWEGLKSTWYGHKKSNRCTGTVEGRKRRIEEFKKQMGLVKKWAASQQDVKKKFEYYQCYFCGRLVPKRHTCWGR